MTVGKFERNAACHLAQAISMEQDWRLANADPVQRVGLKRRTPYQIMREALLRLDMDDTPEMVNRYVRYWVEDAPIIIEFLSDVRKST